MIFIILDYDSIEMKPRCILLFSLFLIAQSCYKIHHTYMIKGEWYIDAVEVDGGTTNQIGAILPNYVDGNGVYKVYMLENGLLRGEYYTYDTLNYFVTGEWQLIENDQIYLRADQYIDGTFKIEPVNAKKMILSTSSNFVTFFNIGEIKSIIRISRGEPGNQSDTRP